MENKDPFEVGMSEMEKFLTKYELRRIHEDFFQKITLLVIASFGFLTAIAWDQVLKLIFIQIFENVNSIGAKLLYALIITIVAAIVSIILTKVFLAKKKKK